MRIVCEHCGAQFTVTSELQEPTPGGVLCPRCQVPVDLPAAAAAAPEPEPAEGSAAVAAAAPHAIDRSAATVQVPARDGGGAASGAPRITPLVNPSADLESYGRERRNPADPIPAAPFLAGQPCRMCSQTLTDPALIAIGICERCRDEQRRNRIPGQDRAAAPMAGLEESSGLLGITTGELVAVAAEAPPTGSEPLTDLNFDTDETRFGDDSLLEPPPGLAPPPVDHSQDPTAPAFRAKPRVSALRVGAAVLTLLAIGAAMLLVLRPWSAGQPRTAAKKPEGPPALPVLAYKLSYWRAASTNLEGRIPELLALGRELALDDRPASDRQAAQAFQRVLVADPANLEAAARWVEVAVLGRGERFDADEALFVRELLAQVFKANPNLHVAFRAQAQLLTLGGRYEEARAAAEEAFKRSPPEERAVALLAWGRTYLTQSAPAAQEKFEAALELDPSLKAAHYYQGLASENAGRYSRAVTAYERRLALDPGHREALRGLIRVYEALGDTGAAREALGRGAASLTDHESKLLGIELALGGGNLDEADRAARTLLAAPDLSVAERASALQYAAAVARGKGRLETAQEHVRAALALAPADPAAHFQAMLVALARRDGPAAREHFAACEARLGDPARAAEYRGRIEFAEGDAARAAASFRRAVEFAPGRLQGYVAGAGALVRSGDEDAAVAMMRHALDLDPASLARLRRPIRPFGESPAETVRLARGAFSPKGEPRWPGVYEAVVAYHLGETAKASALLDRVLVADPTSLPALIYRAQIELDARKFEKALKFAIRAEQAEMQSAVAIYLRGRAYEGLGQSDNARAAYREARQRDPRLLSASARLGLEAEREGRAAEAKDQLLQVLAAEPENLEVRGALFRLGY